jgi:hypothetical protein
MLLMRFDCFFSSLSICKFISSFIYSPILKLNRNCVGSFPSESSWICAGDHSDWTIQVSDLCPCAVLSIFRTPKSLILLLLFSWILAFGCNLSNLRARKPNLLFLASFWWTLIFHHFLIYPKFWWRKLWILGWLLNWD